jgi:hypothetical protein
MPETYKNHRPTPERDSPSALYAPYPTVAKGPAPGLPAYRVIPAGKAFYHVVETATNRVIGYRRQHADACALARQLETGEPDEQTHIQENSGA